MKEEIGIVKILILEKLKEENIFYEGVMDDYFWEEFTRGLLSFSSNPKQLYTLVFELNADHKIKTLLISEIPNILDVIITDLAENYANDIFSEGVQILLSSKNKEFLKQYEYFKVLIKAIEIVEKKAFINELPFMYEKLKKGNLEQEG